MERLEKLLLFELCENLLALGARGVDVADHVECTYRLY